jgi:hypothetical protein
MKQTIEVPWSVGDTCWALLERSQVSSVECLICNHVARESLRSTEVRECHIDSIEVTIRKGEVTFWYRAGFDIGETDPSCGRFTYGSSVKEVFATREEANAAIDRKHHGH